MNSAIVTTDSQNLQANLNQIIVAVTNTLNSDHSKRVYQIALRDFWSWLVAPPAKPFTRATVGAYRAKLVGEGLKPATVNLKLAAVRRLSKEARLNGWLDWQTALAIEEIENVKAGGQRAGTWLEALEVQALLALPNEGTLTGKRDRALLALAVGTGLRRQELASLEWSQITKRRRKYFVENVIGKGNKTRSVPIQRFAVKPLLAWQKASGKAGHVFKRIRKNDNLQAVGLSSQAIRNVVVSYGERLDIELAPHDLRRTFAALLYDADVPIREIQKLLGHASIKTTERYLKPIEDAKSLRDDYFTI